MGDRSELCIEPVGDETATGSSFVLLPPDDDAVRRADTVLTRERVLTVAKRPLADR